MDVSQLKAIPTAPIHVKNAAGEPMYDDGKPIRIIVHGPGTRVYGTVASRQSARIVKRMNDNEGKASVPTAEEALKYQAEDLATITVAFEGLTCGALQGTELFEAVYGDRELGFIASQVQNFVKDWGNFLPSPSANSSSTSDTSAG